MAEYKWMIEGKLLKRVADSAFIPWPPVESHGREAQKWMDEGGVPDPADPPPPQANPLPTI
jgi:hypothetical protein